MNRSVLLVICDFFILTLLSFVEFDNASTGKKTVTEPSPAVASPAMGNMVASLEAALELEREHRNVLTNALASTSAQLAERLRTLAERERALTNTENRLVQSEAEARRLAEERARLERSQGEASASVRELQKAFETSRESAGSLQSALTDSVREAAAARTRLAVMEDELNRRREEARTMQQQISRLDETQERLKDEKQQLALELRETSVEARVVRQAVTNLTLQLAQAGAEKTQLLQTTANLATNVSTLTEQSAAIREQIDRQVRLPANTIHAGYTSNRVRVVTSGTTRSGLGQEVVKHKEGGTVLVRSAGRIFAVLHVEVTALKLWPPDAPWTALGADLGRGDHHARAAEFDLVRRDPRVVAVPIDEAAATDLGVKVYDVATDPAQFAEAVLIGGEETYYGECAFHLSGEQPGYLQMERSTMRRLLGEFSPRRGDLAFSKTGQFLGVLVNGEYCLPFDRAEFLPPLKCGEKLDPAANSAALRSAQAVIERLPQALK